MSSNVGDSGIEMEMGWEWDGDGNGMVIGWYWKCGCIAMHCQSIDGSDIGHFGDLMIW